MKAFLAVVLGFLIGSAVNMGLISVGGHVIPPPDGVDPTNLDSLKENIHLFEPKHFVFMFLAHGLGTLVGAAVATLIGGRRIGFAFAIGVLFLIGGITVAIMLPVPTWVIIADLAVCYIPMAWIGGKLVAKKPQ